jgi:predicted HD superfamily hydrolase involved in NAD metabolism
MKTDCTGPETSAARVAAALAERFGERAALSKLAARLCEKRAAHVLGTVRTAAELAKLHGADVKKAETAALLHDLFRSASAPELDALIDRFGEDPALKGDANLSHGRIAAAFAEAELGIRDEDILNAVRFHTAGRAGMSTQEKILYAADAAEPGRDRAGDNALREAARRDLDEACRTVLKNTLRHLREKGREPHPDSLRALAWFESIKATQSPRQFFSE